MQSEQLFAAALGLETLWYVGETYFEAASKTLTIRVDFHSESRFSHPEVSDEHPVYDTRTSCPRKSEP